jgi:hypothetical protein
MGRERSNGHGADHIENTSCNAFSIVACAYFGRCLETCIHVTILCWRYTEGSSSGLIWVNARNLSERAEERTKTFRPRSRSSIKQTEALGSIWCMTRLCWIWLWTVLAVLWEVTPCSPVQALSKWRRTSIDLDRFTSQNILLFKMRLNFYFRFWTL